MPGTWQPLNNPQPANIDAMLLLTDGSIMCKEYETPNWHKLIPDKESEYANATWLTLSPMPNNAPVGQNGPANAPLYFASAVLRDGTVFCAGGEYNGAPQVDLLAAELYDPVTDIWTPIATPSGWTNIGDAPSCVLPDGRLLLGNADTNAFPSATAIWDPQSGSWSAGGNSLDLNSEEGWTLLPDGTILAVQCTNVPNAQKYVIATNQWVSAGNTGPTLPGKPVNVPPVIYEMGPQILLPDGRVFAIGASGNTAVYSPPTTVPTDPGTWAPGPTFPVAGGNPMAAVDAPACLLPNGNVLCVVGPIDAAGWSDPTNFFEFNPVSMALIPAPAPAIANTTATYDTRLLLLPTGQVMLSALSDAGAYDMQIYTPAGGPNPAWRPHITHVPRLLNPGHVYRLHGRQLNGLSQACAYGDDQQMATNYPLVRLWGRSGVGAVYCRTFDHSTMGVATGKAIHHTHFEVPDDLPHGDYRLVVIANGIASRPVEVRVERRRRDHDWDEHDHEEEIVEFAHEEAKYKDKDAKEAKEKDVKEAKEKEKDIKDVKEKETKEFKDKEKDCKDVEQKYCKEKEHKEFEHKGCKDKEHKEYKDKDCPEQSYCPPQEKSRDCDELLHRVDRLVERIEHIEEEARRRPFIRGEERPDVGERALHRPEEERRREEDRRRAEDERRHRDEERRHHDEERRHHDEESHRQEEERRRLEEERHGAAARGPSDATKSEPPAPGGQPTGRSRRAPPKKR
jgi:hypothetical protein